MSEAKKPKKPETEEQKARRRERRRKRTPSVTEAKEQVLAGVIPPTPSAGRHKVDIDWGVVKSMLEVGCVGTEVAAALGISPSTLYGRCESDLGLVWTEYMQQCQSTLHFRLRGMQIKKALGYWVTNPNSGKKFYIEPDTALLIFLGKQVLGQTEKVETKHTIHGYVIEDEDGNVIEDTTHQLVEGADSDDDDDF